MISFIHLFVSFVVLQQDVMTVEHSTGPSFISFLSTKQRLYYSNLGTRLDCTARGHPSPLITWLRTNNSDNQSFVAVQTSQFTHLYDNGSLFIRPFREYYKPIHAASYVCRAENPIGSIQSTAIQLKPQIYDTYEIEVKNPFGFEQSSVILSCEISPPFASSYITVIGWFEQVNDEINALHLQPRTKYNFLPNRNLIIHNLTKSDDNRSYACVVHNQIDNTTRQSRFKSLRVRNRSPFGLELSVPNNTEYRARVGELIELPCGIASISPGTQLSWWKDGIELDHLQDKTYNNSLILQLSQFSANQTGKYLCQVTDESIGRMTSMSSLAVIVPNKCEINRQKTEIPAGSSSELICAMNSLGKMLIQWQWFHNSIILPSITDRYLIVNASRKHMGMYQCCYISISSDLESCCAQTQVRVTKSPPLILTDHQDHSNTIIVSSPTTFYLNSTIYGDPLPKITLFKDGHKLSPINHIEHLLSGDIFLHNPLHISTLEDTGLYEYLIENALGSVSFSRHLNIDKQKPFIRPLINQTIRRDQLFTISCFGSGQPNLHLQWIDETNKQIVNSSFTSPLLFTSRTTQTTTYTCQARNDIGETSSQLFLTVRLPARVLSTTPNRTIRIHDRLNVMCIAEGDQQLDLMIKTPGKQFDLIENSFDNRKHLSMNIENIQITDSGFYECYARNNYSEDRSIFEIIVQNVPDRVENIFIENLERIFWTEPFSGNAKILNYILTVQYKRNSTWFNETTIIVENHDITSYLFENIFSKCMISVRIQAVNEIGSSVPSDPIYFQTNNKQLQMAPDNLTAMNISANSVILSWQYPSSHLCEDSVLEFVIEITDQFNDTIVYTHKHPFTFLNIDHLHSFTSYTIVINAVNELGPSPKSNPLKIQTLETVPRAMIVNLTATSLNSSSAYITWTFEQNDLSLLHGKFRAFAVTIYENFNMSTLATIETISTNLLLSNLHSASTYYLSVTICNHFDCGSSSIPIDLKTPISNTSATVITHPVNKPLLIDCPLLLNRSLSISPHSRQNNLYQCGLKSFYIQYYDKPSSIQARIHYTTANEIGLKIDYPSEIIESLTVIYKIKDDLARTELVISPPILNIRLANLSCGNIYELTIYATNQAGVSSMEYLTTKTQGFMPALIGTPDFFPIISHDYIILDLDNWIINQCAILSYEIELAPIVNSNQSRHFFFGNDFQKIKITNLEPDEDYQLNIKIIGQAGESEEQIFFRTTGLRIKGTKKPILLILLMVSSFLFLIILILIINKFCRKYTKKTELFGRGQRQLKPVLCSSCTTKDYRKPWLQAKADLTIENYANRDRSGSFESEDSQGNINPYAVTGYKINHKDGIDQKLSTRDNKHVDRTATNRYFCPIILESSSTHNRNSFQRNPLVQVAAKPLLSNTLSTVSSSHNELFSAFTSISSKSTVKNTLNHDQTSTSADSGVHSSYTQSPRCPIHNLPYDLSPSSKQGNPFYAKYDDRPSSKEQHHQYSLV